MMLLMFMNTWVPTCEPPTRYNYDDPSVKNSWISIEGKVLEKNTGNPIGDVTLILDPPAPGSGGTSSRSNSNGDYFFDELGNGRYKIITNHADYRSDTLTVQTFVDSTVTLDIYLTPK